jgi:hypothetical protein
MKSKGKVLQTSTTSSLRDGFLQNSRSDDCFLEYSFCRTNYKRQREREREREDCINGNERTYDSQQKSAVEKKGES